MINPFAVLTQREDGKNVAVTFQQTYFRDIYITKNP